MILVTFTTNAHMAHAVGFGNNGALIKVYTTNDEATKLVIKATGTTTNNKISVTLLGNAATFNLSYSVVDIGTTQDLTEVEIHNLI